MAILRCTVHGEGRTTFGPVVVEPLHHLQMAIPRCIVHSVLRAAFVPVVVQPLKHLQLPFSCGEIHRSYGPSVATLKVKPLERVEQPVLNGVKNLRFPIHIEAHVFRPLQQVNQRRRGRRNVVVGIAVVVRIFPRLRQDASGSRSGVDQPAHPRVDQPQVRDILEGAHIAQDVQDEFVWEVDAMKIRVV